MRALEYRWRLMDLYLNASRPDKVLYELKFLSEHLRNDAQIRQRCEYYKRKYEFGA